MLKLTTPKSAVYIFLAFLVGSSSALILSLVLLLRLSVSPPLAAAGPPAVFYRWLDGQPTGAAMVNRRPVAVMIENHGESRPVSGLEPAGIVYESIVEGDITRFLAIFPGDFSAPKIGPVRSARPFFIDLAQEWQPVYFYSGGSPAALEQLKKITMPKVNEISADGIYFWRDNSRQPPHNLYTSANLINRALAAKGFDLEADFFPWLFKADAPLARPTDPEIRVDFSPNDLYRPVYQYNSQTNDYNRFVNGVVDKTDQGIFLKTRNLVIQYIDSKIIDDYGRLAVDLTSGGRAEIYQDGGRIVGAWQKKNNRTRFYDQAGEEVKFNRGRIWVELVSN